MKKRIFSIIQSILVSGVISTISVIIVITLIFLIYNNNKPINENLSLSIIILILLFFALIDTYFSNKRKTEKEIKKLEKLIKKFETQNENEEENKAKNKFLNLSNILFYFANKEQIRNLYKTYFQEAILDNLISETSGNQTGEIKGKASFIEATIGGNKAKKLTSTYKFDEITLEGMFIRYQREMLRTDQVKLIPEEINYNKKELNAFDKAIQNIQQDYSLSLNQEEVENRKNELRTKSVQNVLASLEDLSGWILIEGKFIIKPENQSYKCVYTHPINDHLPKQPTPITISMTIPSQGLEEHIRDHFARSINTEVPLTAYAKVWHSINRAKGVWDIDLDPLAIY